MLSHPDTHADNDFGFPTVISHNPSTSEPRKAAVELPPAGNADGVDAGLPSRFGFRNGLGGVHTSRTMMLVDLQHLLTAAPDGATQEVLREEIIEHNVLGKRTATTRRKAAKLLTQLYALDPSVPLFRALRYLWKRDAGGQPLLALLCAAARDPVFRFTASAVLTARPGDVVEKVDLEQAISRAAPGHFSTSTLQTTARNAASTWTQAGHLQGHKTKRRARPTVTPAAAAYALLLGYLAGASGQMLLTTFWAKLLDTPTDELASLGSAASARGWIAYRQSGQVIEVRFPELLTPKELEARREQD